MRRKGEEERRDESEVSRFGVVLCARTSHRLPSCHCMGAWVHYIAVALHVRGRGRGQGCVGVGM